MKLMDMARSAEEVRVDASPMALSNTPLYDYGLTLRLNSETLDKLNLDDTDVEVGDMLDFRAMAKVTSVSKHDTGAGEKCCVELQITHMGTPENESTEFSIDGE